MALTHSVEKAYDINKYNVNNFWRVAIEKELKKIRDMETFEIMEGLKQENIQTQKNTMPAYKGNWLSYNLRYQYGWKVYTKIQAGSK